MRNKVWKVNKSAPKDFFEKFPEYSRLTLQLLWDRGLRTQKAIDEFFSPDYDQDLHDPFLLKGVQQAIDRIYLAAENNEKVTIFADYDADGICGGVILSEIFKTLGIDPLVYIPDRNKEGYGLNFEAIKAIAKKGVSLILTIDCGVTDFEEVKLANKLGIDVIIVDHHEVPPKLPPALTIIDPRQKGDKYPFKDLAATGVAFKLLQAFFRTKNISFQKEKWFLDLVAIATVTDSMVLLGENRTLVKYGLIVLSQTKRVGLKELMKTAKIKPVFNPQTLETNLNTYTLGFILGPRINAASRIDHGSTAYKLLTAITEEEAREVSLKLEQRNEERQRTTERILKEARNRVLNYSPKERIIVEGDETWVAGIVGLVAQKLSDEFYLPSCIFQKFKDISIGSVRAIPGFNAVEALSSCRKFLLEFGGHRGAAGFRILNKNIEKFRKAIGQYAARTLKSEEIIPYLYIDAEIDADDLNWINFEQLERFAPFGEGNPTPVFLLKGVTVTEMKSVGNNGCHIKLLLEKETKDGIKKIKAIGFGLADFCDKIKLGDKIDIVFEFIVNEWNGTRELQIKIIDLRKT